MIRCPLTVPLSAFAIFSNSNTIFKSTFVGQDVCFFVARGSLSHFKKKPGFQLANFKNGWLEDLGDD